ncbi:MAG: fructokinase [Enterobacteriaceae bacterium]
MHIGIDLGGTKIEVIALSSDSRELFRHRIATPRHDYDKTLEAIVSLVQLAEQETAQSGSVGVGIPGIISPYSGRVKNANSVWLNGQPLDQDLIRLLGREVRIANDANCFAVSEATDGAAADAQTVFAVIIGTGCGSGMVINKQIHIGRNGIAGEWGHNPLPWQDEEERQFSAQNPCYCGQNGCIETFISGTGMMRDYVCSGGEQATGAQIIERAQQNEPLAQQVLQRYERRIAKSLAHVVNLFDPDVIVLGGGVSNVQRLYQTIPDLMQPWIFGHECKTPIRQAMHGDSSGVRGAAWLWPITA